MKQVRPHILVMDDDDADGGGGGDGGDGFKVGCKNGRLLPCLVLSEARRGGHRAEHLMSEYTLEHKLDHAVYCGYQEGQRTTQLRTKAGGQRAH